MSAVVQISLDTSEWDELLEAWNEPEVLKLLRKARGAYGRAGKPILAAATPQGPSGNKYSTYGGLRRSVRYKSARKRYGIAVVIAPMGREAFYRHMVTGGTTAHPILPRTTGGRLKTAFGFLPVVHHPGAQANPFVARVAGDVHSAGIAKAEDVIFRGLQAMRVTEPEE